MPATYSPSLKLNYILKRVWARKWPLWLLTVIIHIISFENLNTWLNFASVTMLNEGSLSRDDFPALMDDQVIQYFIDSDQIFVENNVTALLAAWATNVWEGISFAENKKIISTALFNLVKITSHFGAGDWFNFLINYVIAITPVGALYPLNNSFYYGDMLTYNRYLWAGFCCVIKIMLGSADATDYPLAYETLTFVTVNLINF